MDNIDAWHSCLQDEGVDLSARRDWCSLYASGGQAKVEGLSIVHSVLKKRMGEHPVRHPSKFVVAGVKAA